MTNPIFTLTVDSVNDLHDHIDALEKIAEKAPVRYNVARSSYEAIPVFNSVATKQTITKWSIEVFHAEEEV